MKRPSLWKIKSKGILITNKIPLRYFWAVVCGYCMDFAIYAAVVEVGISVYWANTTGFCVGSFVNVLLIRTFVFTDSRFRLGTDLQLSLASNGLMFGVGMSMLWGLVELAAMNPYGSKLLANGTTFFVNYMIRKVFFRMK